MSSRVCPTLSPSLKCVIYVWVISEVRIRALSLCLCNRVRGTLHDQSCLFSSPQAIECNYLLANTRTLLLSIADTKPRKIYTQIGKKWTAKNGFYVKKSISQGILSKGNPKHSSQTRPKQAFYLNAKQKGC